MTARLDVRRLANDKAPEATKSLLERGRPVHVTLDIWRGSRRALELEIARDRGDAEEREERQLVHMGGSPGSRVRRHYDDEVELRAGIV